MRSLILSAVAAVTFVFAGSAAQAERLTDKPLVDANWVETNLDNPSLVVVDIRLCALWQVRLARQGR